MFDDRNQCSRRCDFGARTFNTFLFLLPNSRASHLRGSRLAFSHSLGRKLPLAVALQSIRQPSVDAGNLKRGYVPLLRLTLFEGAGSLLLGEVGLAATVQFTVSLGRNMLGRAQGLAYVQGALDTRQTGLWP